MLGLIYSKAAPQYADWARAAGLQFATIDSAQNLNDVDLTQVTWLLAEPSLALPILHDLPNLRWLQSTWAGVESLLATPNAQNYTLTNIKGVFAPLMSEYVMAHCLAHERELYAHHAAKLQQQWRNDAGGVIRGKTMLIMGVGSIGSAVAAAARFFGMHVLGVVNSPRPMDGLDEVGGFANLSQFLPRADYVVNILPNTPATQNIVDAAFLAQMKSSAVFINVGRGQAVLEADLATALHNGTIAGAVLDVYRTEPLPIDHVFWHTPNLTLTSHTAAPSYPADIFAVFIDNYQRLMRGEPLLYTVDFTRGY